MAYTNATEHKRCKVAQQTVAPRRGCGRPRLWAPQTSTFRGRASLSARCASHQVATLSKPWPTVLVTLSATSDAVTETCGGERQVRSQTRLIRGYSGVGTWELGMRGRGFSGHRERHLSTSFNYECQLDAKEEMLCIANYQPREKLEYTGS